MTIRDKRVVEILQRGDFDSQEKLILIALLKHRHEPPKKVSKRKLESDAEFEQRKAQIFAEAGAAKTTVEDLEKDTGISPRVINDRLSKLEDRHIVAKTSSGGRIPNRYRVHLRSK